MNPHFEAIVRILGVFISVFFTLKWGASTNPPTYDVPLTIFAVMLAIILNYI
jgi:uncharacterized membrane protein YdbT with pleckstrin-like domain